jgi:hypothetical protein
MRMAHQRTFSIRLIEGHNVNKRRAVAFLECNPVSDEINAKTVFVGIPESRDRELRTRFDYWLDGGVNKKWFHGWDNPPKKGCFTFKWKDKKQEHRFYGFICNPLPDFPSFQLCVLICDAPKNTWESPGELDEVIRLKDDLEVNKAIERFRPHLRRAIGV